jgi:hypothetical protein
MAFDELRLTALVIEIFIPEDQFAVSRAGALPRHPEGARVSQVKISGG